MSKPVRLIIDAMLFGQISYDYFNGKNNNLTKKILQKKHVVIINYKIENNYEGFFIGKKIPGRIAKNIKDRFLKHLENNNVLKNLPSSIWKKLKFKIKVPSDDYFYFQTAVAAKSTDKFWAVLLTEDPNWHKIAPDFRKKHKVCICSQYRYLS